MKHRYFGAALPVDLDPGRKGPLDGDRLRIERVGRYAARRRPFDVVAGDTAITERLLTVTVVAHD